MKVVRAIVLLAVACPLLLAQDAHEIVRRAVELDKGNDENWRNFVYLDHELRKEFDGSGNVKTSSNRTFEVTFVDGSPYRKLVARDEKPLSPEEAKAEEDRRLWNIEQRAKEPKEQREKRVSEWRKRQERQREPLQEIPDAFTFQMVGSETIAGMDAYVIDAVPRPGYKPKSTYTSFLPKMKARVWISKRDAHWIKIDGETIDSFSYGGFVVRIGKGTRITMEQGPVGGGVWLPTRIALSGSVRIMLVKSIRAQLEMTYSQYRKS
jgi:hypothetical protein